MSALDTWAGRLDRFSIATGRAVSWLTLLMVLATCAVVVARYVFGAGLIWLQESLTWMHAAVFMLGAAYALACDDHVRVDVFYRGMSARRRALVNVAGVLLFLLPLCILIFIEAWPYVGRSWAIREISRDSGGLPFPAVPLLKTVVLVMPAALVLQGTALLLRAAIDLRRN